jgi:protein-arginine kinase activator protein McsA
MAHTYEDLHGMTVAQLREVAEGIEHEAVHGYSTMHKEELLPALCTALGIEAHEHHEVVGINKSKVKEQIRALKVERDQLVESGDSKQLKRVRRKIRRLKRKIRKATI